jgi:CheY-like chemotaxis protein
MDMMMPGQDGFQAIRDVHRLERFREVPIIAVTAMAMKGDREKCIAAGASDYVTKPVDVEQLVSIAGLWLAA